MKRLIYWILVLPVIVPLLVPLFGFVNIEDIKKSPEPFVGPQYLEVTHIEYRDKGMKCTYEVDLRIPQFSNKQRYTKKCVFLSD